MVILKRALIPNLVPGTKLSWTRTYTEALDSSQPTMIRSTCFCACCFLTSFPVRIAAHILVRIPSPIQLWASSSSVLLDSREDNHPVFYPCAVGSCASPGLLSPKSLFHCCVALLGAWGALVSGEANPTSRSYTFLVTRGRPGGSGW